MALAGGGAAAAADAGLRLAARPPALPPSAAAALSRPPPPPRAPLASQPSGDSPTPPTPIPPRDHGPSAHSTYALPRPEDLAALLPPPLLLLLLLLLLRHLRPAPHTFPARLSEGTATSGSAPPPGSVSPSVPLLSQLGVGLAVISSGGARENRGTGRRPFWNREPAAGARRPYGGRAGLCP
ncbi:formin-like protein 18 [Catharus ustulatus]|uniref:formin-like protein 18 n=1 Tax=Catharus ustulatus TaxID=91951 RepID=UPI001407AA46|nr:formin-like protein 18 [Catharus ustulatus]